ncbi:MAG TPA: hypothetical protein VG869_05410 [Acidimicrobiia bacterium]|jgi:hypothetical protein|nr:hypothetical protein [Acidimicrobiia bacterium]
MDELSPITWYVSRRVELPVEVAAPALDRIFDTHDREADRPSAPLGVGAATVATTPSLGPTRRCNGSLRLDRWSLPVAVELELEPWSSLQSAIGIRPRRRPPTRRARRYWSRASTILEWLDSELLAVAPVVGPARRAS